MAERLKSSTTVGVWRLSAALVTLTLLRFVGPKVIRAAEPFRIHIVDEVSGWPVPLVQLRTTHNVVFVSDNAGNVAIDLPELMQRETWFSIRSDGYEVPADGFGYRGVRLVPQPGEVATVKVRRTSLAQRLGRLTGAGLFGESQQCGLETDWRESGVFGCDSVQVANYRNKLFWAWGDTTIARYPLGVFDTTGATTGLRPLQDFQPPLRLTFDYFRAEDSGPRAIAPMPGKGPTWISGLASVRDHRGEEKLVACYSKIEPPLASYEEGLCVWDDAQQTFRPWKVLWKKTDGKPRPTHLPIGHAIHWDDADGKSWLLFGDPFPALKCEPTLEAWQDPNQWQPLEPQVNVQTVDGQSVKAHRGSIAWNAYRQKWITIFCEVGGGPSYLGEIWYAEADSPYGEWQRAVKVVSHDHYTFYNPLMHPELHESDAGFILFEATYTHTFSKAKEITGRYDYNQLLYRLDLDELPD